MQMKIKVDALNEACLEAFFFMQKKMKVDAALFG